MCKEVPRQNPEPDNVETTTPQKPDFSEFEGTKLYFHNDKPDSKSRGVTSSVLYDTTYNNYLALESEYLTQSDSIGQKQQVQTFFDTNIKVGKTQLDSLIDKLVEAATNKYKVNINLTGSASSPNDKSYNINLSKRRVDSVKKQILGDPRIKKLNEEFGITVQSASLGEETIIDGVDCSKKITNEVAKIYSIDAMACRRTTIKSIVITAPPIEDQGPTDEEIVKVDTVFDKVPVIEKGKKRLNILTPLFIQ